MAAAKLAHELQAAAAKKDAEIQAMQAKLESRDGELEAMRAQLTELATQLASLKPKSAKAAAVKVLRLRRC